MKHFSWGQLFVFELSLVFLAIMIDYLFTFKYGLDLVVDKIGIENLNKLELEK